MDYTKDYFCFVPGNFIFGDFLEALIYKKKLRPKEVYITTLGMGENNIDSIVNMVDYLGCEKVNLLISHYFQAVERHRLIPYMEREFSGRPIDVAVLQSHCKIALIFSDKGNVLISGSANLSSSNNVEQFVIQHDKKSIKYVKSCLDNVMEKFTVYTGADRERHTIERKSNTGKSAYKTLIGKDE